LQRIGPAQRSAIQELPRRFKHARIQRLLDHPRGFDAQKFERGSGGFRRDLPAARRRMAA